MTALPLLRMPVPMRRVNDLLFESVDRRCTDPVAFFCECDRADCYLPVWLTPAEYEDARARRFWRALAWSHGQAATG